MQRIAYLLSRQNQVIPAIALSKREPLPREDTDQFDLVAEGVRPGILIPEKPDLKTLQILNRKLDDLDERIKLAETESEREELRSDHKKLARYIKDTAQENPQGPDPVINAIKAVQQSLREAYKAMKNVSLKRLADHLEGAIKRQGAGLIYSPSPVVEWDVTESAADH